LYKCAMVWAQTPTAVQELQAAELPGYLQQHPKAFVLLTSPDPKCGYCIGADTFFEQAVQKVARPDWRYIRVQWAPWRAFPPEVVAMKVTAIPSRAAVLQGQIVGWADGQTKDIDVLSQGILAAKRGENWSAPSRSRPQPQIRAQAPPPTQPRE